VVSLLLLTSLLLLATHYHPNAPLVASDSAVADITAAIGFPWVQAVLKALAIVTSLLLLLVLLLLTSQESLLWPPSLLLLTSLLLMLFPPVLVSLLVGVPCCSSCLLYYCQLSCLCNSGSFCINNDYQIR